ncbi:DUF4148 domain-containing protein [Burkholderia ambifaria]|uniref:DUF4148 domain-containing protein n=1 Tax=Burkholderia ambifaria TaxID=152480 RepID=UPI0039F5E60E
MKKHISLIAPLLSAIALSVTSAPVHASTPCHDNSPQAATRQDSARQSESADTAHPLTRREVIEDLIRAEQDGSLQRLNETVYNGS